jgi:hypothetical protein
VRTQNFRDNPNNGVNGPGGHLGIDIACPEGTPVRACGDGTILFSDWASNIPGGVANEWAFIPSAAGGLVLIDHGPGEPASSYGHMMETYFNPGDFVKGGTIIGLADTTGLATGSHLHFDFLAPVYHMVAPMWGRVNPDDYCRGYWDDLDYASGDIISDPIVDHKFVTGSDGVRRRQAPDKNAPLIDEFLPNREITVGGYVRTGVAPYPGTTDIWLVGGLTGGYMWLGSFINQDISAIPDLTPAITPPPTPPGVPDTPPVVVAPPYDFTVDIPVINGITVEKIAANGKNVEVGNMPASVMEIIKHWWNDIPNRPQMDNVAREFQGETFKSAHLLIVEYRIIQMVALKDRAYHAGPEGNNRWGFEIDPYVTEMVDGQYTERALRIQANVKAAHRALELHAGRELRARLHNEFMNTRCAEIDLLTVEPDRTEPVPPPTPEPGELDEFLDAFETFIRDYRNK